MPEAGLPTNTALVKLSIEGLAGGEANAFVAWHPKISFDAPVLVVLFFHGLEKPPQAKASTGHCLPGQVALAAKNAVLIAPTMRVAERVDGDYLASHQQVAKLLEEGILAIGGASGRTVDRAGARRVVEQGKLLLVAYSNGHVAWSRFVTTLRSGGEAAASFAPIGHALFDCLYWSTPLMEGVRGVPIGSARFSKAALAIAASGFVTTHFTSANETLSRAEYLEAMVPREPALRLHADVPAGLQAGDVVVTRLPTDDHGEAVASRHELKRVIAAVSGFDLASGVDV